MWKEGYDTSEYSIPRNDLAECSNSREIHGFRETLPGLPALHQGAPLYLNSKRFETTKILVAYDVDAVLELPEPSRSAFVNGPKTPLKSDLFGTFPFVIGADGVIHTQMEKNSRYATVLAVLADLV